jgi:hypothetical protein
MEEKILKILLIQLKVIAMACVGCMLFFLTVSFKSENYVDDVWKQLGITKGQAEVEMTETFLKGYLYSYTAVKAKNVLSGNRVAITKDLLNYCKNHINSEAFKKEYVEYRKRIKPTAPSPKSKEQVRIELISHYEEAIKNEQGCVNMALIMEDQNMRKHAERAMAKCRKILEEVNTGNSKLLNEQMIYADMQYKSDLKAYQFNLYQWEKNYPTDSRQLVRMRLQHFLDLTNDINFNARLKEVNGKKIFVDPVYERKPAGWKMGYRAGKEVVQTARTFAEQWMKEL